MDYGLVLNLEKIENWKKEVIALWIFKGLFFSVQK